MSAVDERLKVIRSLVGKLGGILNGPAGACPVCERPYKDADAIANLQAEVDRQDSELANAAVRIVELERRIRTLEVTAACPDE